MVDEKLAADFSTGVYFNTCQESADMGGKSSQEIELIDPEQVGYTVDPQRVQARIAENDLKHVACGRVAFKDRIYILAKVFEHGEYLENQ
jgi:hypothetical protein